MGSLTTPIDLALSSLPEVTRLTSLRRSTALFLQSQPADSLYLIEDGLVKLTRTNHRNGRIIIAICGPGHIVGEECIEAQNATYYSDGEVLIPSTVSRVPRETLLKALQHTPELGIRVLNAVIEQKRVLAEKVELLCLHDVEYRILHYLAELSSLLKPSDDGDGFQLPITQLELADLIGATRETTSTTLNQLERRGLVKLSRRLLTIPSPDDLRGAAQARHAGTELTGQAAHQ